MKSFKAWVRVHDGYTSLVTLVTVQADNLYAATMIIRSMYGMDNVQSPVMPA
jgi:hypothetical protein